MAAIAEVTDPETQVEVSALLRSLLQPLLSRIGREGRSPLLINVCLLRPYGPFDQHDDDLNRLSIGDRFAPVIGRFTSRNRGPT